jgi:amino acid adenylation domain-containing protein
VARARPDAVAVRRGDRALTYGELDRRAGGLARHLRGLGAGPESVVGVLVDRSPELAVALLGVLAAGAAYLPLDPDAPPARSAALLDGVGAALVLTTSVLRGRLAGCRAAAVALDELDVAPAALPAAGVAPGGLAYVVHTSGSTGRPNAVMVTHGALAAHALAIAGRYELTAGDRVLQFASIAFDVAAEELYPTWIAGAEVVLAARRAMTPAELEAEAARAGVTVLNLPAAYWATWAWELEREPRPLPPSVRLVVVGSEAVPAEALRSWGARPGPALRNAYGVSEATITSTVADLDPAGVEDPVPIGHPIAGTAAHVVGADLEPVPGGAEGELLLGGAGVARGYLGQPGLTAARFVPDPFGPPGARAYRTGDLVRRLEGGALAFRGRLDDQVKVRGHRVEPAEVAARLREHPDVAVAFVAARRDRPGTARLVAYLVPRDPRRIPGGAELRALLVERLPAPMLPDGYVVLDAMPLTAGGKVDRRALPPDRPPARPRGAAPATGLERTVAAIWREVLDLPDVGLDDDLLELGGGSLGAMRAVARLRAATGVEVPLAALFEARTVARVARLVEERRGPARPALPDIRPGPPAARAPLSLQQEQVWFLTRLAPGSVAYHAQTTIRLAGPLDAGVLERSVTELVRRHEILRTTFEEVDGTPWQVVHPPGPARVARVDLRGLPATERAARAEALVRDELRRPFDLARLPLARWTLIRLGPEEHELVLVEHHLVHDGWSFALLMRELAAVHRAYARGEEPGLPEPALQYADFARWQRAAMASEGMAAQLEHWRTRLAGAPQGLALPADRPRPRHQSFHGGLVRAELAGPLRTALRALCREHGVTLFMTLLSAFAVLAGRLTGERDVCVGSAFANRRQRQTEELLGMLVNTVVLRWDLADDPTVAELLARTRAEVLAAAANQEAPFGRVVERLNPDRDPSRNPVVQVMFSFDDSPLAELDLGGCAGTVYECHNGSAKLDMHVVVEPRSERQVGEAGRLDDRITLLWSYNSDLFDAATAERVVARYVRLLEAAVAAPGTRVSALPLLDEAELRTLRSWAVAPPPAGTARLAHELVEQRAAAHPDRPAVRFRGEQLTYGELDRRASLLARTLDAGPGSVVALGLPRSLELVVAVLAVLKSGAAYLPVDAAEPPARLRRLLSAAGASMLLTPAGSAPAARSGLAAPGPARPDDLAYVICTSGSTGVPKAVGVPHRALACRLQALQEAHRLTPDDRVLQKTPSTFDVSVWELLWPLSVGALLVVAEPEGHRDPAYLVDVIARERVTTAHFVPSMLAAFLDQPDLGRCGALARVASGGEALTAALRDRCLAALPAELHNFYGPTEACIEAVAWRCRAGDGPVVPIGRPIAGTEAHVLGPVLEPVPVGVPGELCLGGPGLARGYLARPDLTAERFVPHPFAVGERLYRTGDVVRWRPDGTLDFLGRADDQVKLRGYRIEPGEVAAALREHPAVAAAHVAAARTEAALVAHVVPRDPRSPPDEAALREHLRDRLPAHLVPASYVVLDAFPLTPHGKLDRRALPDPVAPAAAAHRPPLTDLQRRLAGVWEEVLGRPRIGLEDDFFALGGHSVLAARIVARLRADHGLDVSIVTLFDHPTIAALAGALGDR